MQGNWNPFDSQANENEVKRGSGWALTALTIGLFLVTGYRTAHYIWGTLPADWWFISIAGVLAFDGGAILWSRAWEGNASNDQQDAIAKLMFVVDVIGMLLTSLADSVDGGVLPPQIVDGVKIAVPAIIVINVVAGIVYGMLSDAVAIERENRKANAELARQKRQADNQTRITEAKAFYQQDMLEQQEALLAQQEKITEQQMRIDAMRRGLKKANAQGDHVDAAADNIAARMRKHFAEHPDMARRNGNGQKQLDAGVTPLDGAGDESRPN